MTTQVRHNQAQFTDRYEAGRKLGHKLHKYAKESPIVLALPRGGVEIGYELAKNLGFPLSVIVSRKLGAPNNKEFGIGAVSESATYLNKDSLKVLGLSEEETAPLIALAQAEVKRRIKLYRGGKSLSSLKNNVAILVDDGLATGATAIAAILSLRHLSPRKIVFAAPIVSNDALAQLKSHVDEVIFLEREQTFGSVSSFYKHFNQVSDKTVLKLLASLIPN